MPSGQGTAPRSAAPDIAAEAHQLKKDTRTWLRAGRNLARRQARFEERLRQHGIEYVEVDGEGRERK